MAVRHTEWDSATHCVCLTCGMDAMTLSVREVGEILLAICFWITLGSSIVLPLDSEISTGLIEETRDDSVG